MSLCLLTPRLPPKIDGVGDYSFRLWKSWPDPSEQWKFLVLESADESRNALRGAPVRAVHKSKSSLQQELKDEGKLLLQYSLYGYDRNGAPEWLIAALTEWKAQNPQSKLAIMFHETWATGKPWQKAFWQTSSQKRCLKQLLQLADVAVTSNEANKRDLDSLNITTEVSLIPLGPSFDVSAGDGKNWQQLLIFGQQGTRLRSLERHEDLIKALVSNGTVKKIVIGGKAADVANEPSKVLLESWHLPVEIEEVYNFDPERVPTALTNCGLAIISTQSTYLLKSSVFQTVAQIGTIAITLHEHEPGSPLINGEHFLSYTRSTIPALIERLRNTADLEKISRNVRQLSKVSFSWESIGRRWKEKLDDH
jgi:hypothetical protein